jgi:hypothetical protein
MIFFRNKLISSPLSLCDIPTAIFFVKVEGDRGEDTVPLRFTQIRECGMPQSGSEGEHCFRSTLTPALSRQREREINI